MTSRSIKISPAYITELSRCEIFVFGSNLEGQHYGGAARTAYEKFGAEWGVGEGPTGRCYAIPTMHGGIEEIKPYADRFLQYAKEHPMNRFLVTRVGCGIAGFKDEEIAPLFLEAIRIPNVALPIEWIKALSNLNINIEKELGAWQRPNAPKIISEEVLHDLAKKYAYPISVKLPMYIPSVRIRYVIDSGEFGYTALCNCFFFEDGGMYVWDDDERWKVDHNQDMVECVFGDECCGRGYAHRAFFAGVATGVEDCDGEMIYTGDVLQIGTKKNARIFALGTVENDYAFLLDNHSLSLSDCKDEKLKKVGTVFYQLDRSETPVPSLNDRVMRFQGGRDTAEDREFKRIKARLAPNFEQKIWKYRAMDILGIEFNQKK